MSQSEDVINIQILYNPNQLIESEYWNGTLQPVSLHDSSEHLLSNMKNIKNSMIHITKYVENKKININKSNEVPKLRSISKVTWKLISAIYSSKWDLLFADNNNNSFRQKVSFKCILNVNPMKDRKKEEKNIKKPVSIEGLPPPILAKLSKEVKEISKFFKMTSSTNVNKNNGKLYIQASHSGNNTRDVLKIKKVFPNLQAEKIKNIQKFIKGNGKSKPKLIMTIKGLSRKQVIVSINNDNKTSFMEDSSNHVTSLNRALRVLTTSKPMRLKFHGYPNPNLTSKS